MSLMENEDVMKKVYENHPRKSVYNNEFEDGKHICRWGVIYCNNDRDIVRCIHCGHEKEVKCTFDDEYN